MGRRKVEIVDETNEQPEGTISYDAEPEAHGGMDDVPPFGQPLEDMEVDVGSPGFDGPINKAVVTDGGRRMLAARAAQSVEVVAFEAPAARQPNDAPDPRNVPVSMLMESSTNPRRTFPPMDDLIASVKVHGILAPLLVRPQQKGDEAVFEIVAGHRRYRAAKEAGLEYVPVIVRIMGDAQVLEAQLTENLQRADIHPMEEAEGYGRLHRSHGYIAERISERVGKSKAYIYARMKLLDLCEPVRKLFYSGKVNATTAVLLARIPDASLQEQAATEICNSESGEPLSSRAAFLHIQSNYMTRLTDAPFSPKDDLLTSAGACTACPKRSGNDRDLFGDIERTDICTDIACYRQKVDANWVNAKEQAKAKGWDVMSVSESQKLFRTGSISPDSPWVLLDGVAAEDPDKRTWRELIGKEDVPVTLARDLTGKPKRLIERSRALALAGDELTGPKGKKRSKDADDEVPATAEEKAKAKRDAAVRAGAVDRAMSEMVAKVERKELDLPALRLMVLGIVHVTQPDAVLERREWKDEIALEKMAEDKLNGRQLQGLVFELATAELFGLGSGDPYSDALKAACRGLGVDLKALEKEERAALDGEKKAAAR